MNKYLRNREWRRLAEQVLFERTVGSDPSSWHRLPSLGDNYVTTRVEELSGIAPIGQSPINPAAQAIRDLARENDFFVTVCKGSKKNAPRVYIDAGGRSFTTWSYAREKYSAAKVIGGAESLASGNSMTASQKLEIGNIPMLSVHNRTTGKTAQDSKVL